jgi:DNA primase catalytic core
MARITPEIVAEMKTQIDISTVIERFIPVKKQGNRWVAVCPFHDDHSPSMNITPAMGIYKCFACGAGGDMFKFVQDHEKVEFPEAVEIIADMCGFQLPQSDADTPAVKEKKEKKAQLVDANVMAGSFFQRQLSRSTVAQSYLANRKIDAAIIEELQLGWAPDSWDALLAEGVRKGVGKSILLEAGLIVEKEGGKSYDKFRARLMFPIHNMTGRIIAFGGRVLGKDDKPKYLNSPETLLYSKSETLYGLYFARKEIATTQDVIFVEGYFDFLQLYQKGIKNVVSVSGTALTQQHAKILTRYAKRAFLVFDGDTAGRKAARRSVEILAPDGIETRILLLPEGEDPDSIVREHGADYFRERLDGALDLAEFLCEDPRKNHGSPESRAALAQEVRDVLMLIKDPLVRNEYFRRAAALLDIDQKLLMKPSANRYTHKPKNTRQGAAPSAQSAQYPSASLSPQPGSFSTAPPPLQPGFDNLEYLIPEDGFGGAPGPDFYDHATTAPATAPSQGAFNPSIPSNISSNNPSSAKPSSIGSNFASNYALGVDRKEARFVSLIMNKTILHGLACNTLDATILQHPDLADIVDTVLAMHQQGGAVDMRVVYDRLNEQQRAIFQVLPSDENWSDALAVKEYAETLLRFHILHLERNRSSLRRKSSELTPHIMREHLELSNAIKQVQAIEKQLRDGSFTPEAALQAFLEISSQ